MAQINEWLSIDKANGSGDATITLTASSSTELTERMASLEIKGVTKSVYINITQNAYVAPSKNNDYFWIKLEESGDIQGLRTTFEYSYNLTNWNSCPTTLNVPADTYVWFRNTSSILNAENTSTILFTQRGSIGGDLSSMGDMRESNFRELFAENVGLVDASELLLPWDRVVNRCFYNMFGDCVNLISPPELPATELEGACYIAMFSGCESLNIAPVLPATTLSFDPNGDTYGCYQNMFSGCISLMTAPTLPATILVNKCYMNMFFGCTSLMTAPSLPATSLANSCYQGMFFGCTLLPKTPSLPATTIPKNAYLEMFRGCTRLTTISHIGATDLSEADGMFRECTSLTEFEVSEWVTDMSSNDMFNGCTNLKTIIAHPSTAPIIRSDTFRGIAEDGTLIYPTGSDYSSWLSTNSYYLGYYGWNDTESGGGNEDDDVNNDYFWIKLEENGDIQGLKVGTFQHSYDRINWYYSPATLSVPANTYVWFRNTYPPILNAENETKIHFTKRGSIGGNISSIGDMRERNFIRLFYGNENLVDASELILPWDVLTEGCYELMFCDCTSLTTAPVLPATTLASDCYNWMFCDCTSLTTAPELPATTLAKSCYLAMFRGCTSLTTAPTLPATTLAEYCYFEMFDKCTSLTTAPTLPATTLVEWCYAEMFFKCENLTMVECHAEDISADFCLDSWLYRVSPTGTFIKKQGVTYPIGGDNGIPSGWTIQNIA